MGGYQWCDSKWFSSPCPGGCVVAVDESCLDISVSPSIGSSPEESPSSNNCSVLYIVSTL